MNLLAVRIGMYVFAAVVDLVTTLILLQSGRGIEANPIAAQFAHDPAQLIAFKTVVTGMVVFVACRLAAIHRALAETAMAAATAITVFVVLCGLSTVPPLVRPY